VFGTNPIKETHKTTYRFWPA